jgi:hypothetical protein
VYNVRCSIALFLLIVVLSSEAEADLL